MKLSFDTLTINKIILINDKNVLIKEKGYVIIAINKNAENNS